jgi:asparagine synthase (glutamine-hydrolysing)
VDQWLRGPFLGLLNRYIEPDALRNGGVFDPDAVVKLTADHIEGRRDHGNRLWLILQLQIWRERWEV